MRIGICIALGSILLSAVSLAAQEGLAPSDEAPRQEPALERLEALRFQRLQNALGLSDEQTRMLRRQVNANREAMRAALERERTAVQELERTLASEPVDEQGLARSLDAVEAARADMERLRREQIEGLSRVLTPEQRARYLLFNRRFDARLRELIDQRRGRATDAPADRVAPRRLTPNDRP